MPSIPTRMRTTIAAASLVSSKIHVIAATELFDLRDDPRKQANVAGRHPDLVAKLDRALDQWRDRLVIGTSEEFDLTGEELREFTELDYVGERKPKRPSDASQKGGK